jgi:cyclophilin family peptidyl-prolyl cis-trans isomerase
VGKAAKRERQKINKSLREEEQARKESRTKMLRAVKGIALVLIVPLAILVTTLINNATDPDVYTAKITVAIDGEKDLPNDGVIEVELDQAFSPDSVKHFNGFASNGLYDGLTWHRAVKDFVIQGGDPNGDGSGSLGASVQVERPRDGYQPGDIAWAKGSTDPVGTAGSQFFIVTGSEDSEGLKALNEKVDTPDGTKEYNTVISVK